MLNRGTECGRIQVFADRGGMRDAIPEPRTAVMILVEGDVGRPEWNSAERGSAGSPHVYKKRCQFYDHDKVWMPAAPSTLRLRVRWSQRCTGCYGGCS